MGLRKLLDDLEPQFTKGGKYEKLFPLYEAVDTFLYSPSKVTISGTHVRDGVDLKRIMITVWLATFPAMFYGMYNVGHQANWAMLNMGIESAPGWRGAIMGMLGGYSPESIWDC